MVIYTENHKALFCFVPYPLSVSVRLCHFNTNAYKDHLHMVEFQTPTLIGYRKRKFCLAIHPTYLSILVRKNLFYCCKGCIIFHFAIFYLTSFPLIGHIILHSVIYLNVFNAYWKSFHTIVLSSLIYFNLYYISWLNFKNFSFCQECLDAVMSKHIMCLRFFCLYIWRRTWWGQKKILVYAYSLLRFVRQCSSVILCWMF